MNVRSSDEPKPSSESSPGSPPTLTAVTAIHLAAEQFSQITGRQPDGVTGVRATPDGWSVLIDVVELERIPASTSVLATYRVDVDKGGALVSCERLRRYTRGTTDI
ncbi:gas vesicle protein GvpO [Kibdelosporangium aridum]|nr:gas vesicle protein [Kibdelosporangium aridum]